MLNIIEKISKRNTKIAFAIGAISLITGASALTFAGYKHNHKMKN